MPQTGKTRLQLDGDWGLYDFADFGRGYSQAYSLLYVLMFVDDEFDGRLEHAFTAYPWRGGYSAVNFYQSIQYRVPRRERPRVEAIRYESPGWMDLTLATAAAAAVRQGVKALLNSFEDANRTYSQIYKDMQERKLTQINIKRQELELKREDLRFASEAFDLLASKMKMERELRERMRELSPNDLASLKILLSLYRRIRDLAKLERSGKMRF